MRVLWLAPFCACVLVGVPARAATSSATTNPNWFNGYYCLDNSNQSTCASDLNDGATCGCTGGGTRHGPLKTFAHLWYDLLGCGAGGMCPRYVTGHGLGNMKIDVLSNDTAEVVNFDIANISLSGIVFHGVLDASKTVGTGTLSSFTAKPTDRKTGITATFASGLNKAAIAGITLALNELVFDSTNPSYFWPYYDITTAGGTPGIGDTWAFDQPVLGGYDPFQSQQPAEVTIASGDSVTVYRPPVLLVNEAIARIYAGQAGNNIAPQVWFDNLVIGNDANHTMNSNNGIGLEYCAMVENAQFIPGSNGLTALVQVSSPLAAVDLNNTTAGAGGQQNLVLGGMYGTPTSPAQDAMTCTQCSVDGDTVFGQEPGLYGATISNFIGRAYVDHAAGFLIYPNSVARFQAVPISPFAPTGTQLWGPGGLQIFGGAEADYPFGAGQAAATFTMLSNMSIFQGSGATTLCFVDPTLASPTIVCGIAATAAAADTKLGAVNGCLQAGIAGGKLCN